MTAEHPEGWTPDAGVDEADVERALERIDAEAAEHGADYRAGMRHARLIVEETVNE